MHTQRDRSGNVMETQTLKARKTRTLAVMKARRQSQASLLDRIKDSDLPYIAGVAVMSGLAAFSLVKCREDDSTNLNPLPYQVPVVNGGIYNTAEILCPESNPSEIVDWVIEKNRIDPKATGSIPVGALVTFPDC